VAGIIAPWNSPIVLFIRSVAPPLASRQRQVAWAGGLQAAAVRIFWCKPGPFPNIAWHRPAGQSPTSVWFNHPDARQDAAGANDGRREVEFNCHTDVGEDPWWRVDLQAPSLVHGIRIQNRCPFEQRLNGLQIQSSMDGVAWTVVHAEAGQASVGGADPDRPA